MTSKMSKRSLEFSIFLSICPKFGNSFVIFIEESDTASCVGTSNDFRLILTSVRITQLYSHARKIARILWFSHPLYFLSTLFNSEWNWNHLSFLMIRSHFKYLVSSHQKDTYQIISYKDIPNLFRCSVTNCSVADLLSNQKCLDSPGWTMPFPSWTIQQLPDVVFSFTAAVVFWHLCCTSPAGWPFVYETAFHTSDYFCASSRIVSTALL